MGLFDTPEIRPSRLVLRPYQEEGVAAARAEFGKGIKSTTIVMATGTGKMVVGAMVGRMAAEKGKRTLFLCQTDELIRQAAKTFDLAGIDVGIEKAEEDGRSVFDPWVVVGSVMTMMNPRRLKSYARDWFDLVIVDECHHAVSGSHKVILAWFKDAKILGLTATPVRNDGVDLGTIFESNAFEFNLEHAWNAPYPGPYCCDILRHICDVKIDLRKLKPQKGDFSDADLDARIAPMIEMLGNKIREVAGERQTINFCPSVRTARALAQAMRDDLGCSIEAVWGQDPDREQKIERYRTGELQMLANYGLLTEGFDVPNTSAIGLLRPTGSWTVFSQMIGRGLRPGKENCLLIDFNYIYDQFKLVQPVDMIATPCLDQERAEILRRITDENPEMSLKTAIEQTDAEQKERRRQHAIRMSIAERQIDCYEEVYSVRETMGEGADRIGSSVGPAVAKFVPATERQIAYLRMKRIAKPERMSKSQAGALIGKLRAQEEAGKAHPWQRKAMMRNGVDAAEAREMSVDQASQYLDQIDRFRERRAR